MYAIDFTERAIQDLAFFRKFEQQMILTAIEDQLTYEPAIETRNRKQLRPNDFAEWELRVGQFRVFYDVQVTVTIVQIEGIGYKEGNRLYLRGKEFEL